MQTALVLLSGGLDSLATLALCVDRLSASNVSAMLFDYGSKHSGMEEVAARRICENYGIHLHSMAMPIGRRLRSALTKDCMPIPKGPPDDPIQQSTVVPGRNLMMIAQAAALAESEGVGLVAIGAHDGDAAIYPDCRQDFLDAAGRAVRLSSSGRVELWAPLLGECKAGVAAICRRLNAPIQLTYTCYAGRSRACGRCGACVERLEAFKSLGIEDPMEYEPT